MDNIFGAFLNSHTIAFIIGCYALTWLTRRCAETAKPSLRAVRSAPGETNSVSSVEIYTTNLSRWWNSFILYLIPPAWGMLGAALLHPYLKWPEGFEALQAAIFFGMVCGWLSGLLYKFLMKLLLQKLGVDEADAEKVLERVSLARATKKS